MGKVRYTMAITQKQMIDAWKSLNEVQKQQAYSVIRGLARDNEPDNALVETPDNAVRMYGASLKQYSKRFSGIHKCAVNEFGGKWFKDVKAWLFASATVRDAFIREQLEQYGNEFATDEYDVFDAE